MPNTYSEAAKPPAPASNGGGSWVFVEVAAEARRIWSGLPYRRELLGLLGAWVLLFQFLGSSTFGYADSPSLFGWFHYAYQNREDDEHGYLIPFVVLFLLWLRRDELGKIPLRPSWTGLVLLAVGLLIHVAGFVIQQARVSFIGFIIGLYGITGITWGVSWLRLAAFPFCFFAFCIPLGSYAQYITFPLRMVTTELCVGFCNFFLGIELVQDGTMIFAGDRSFGYDVAPACSGIRSLFALLALTAVYGFLALPAWWQRLAMFASAVPLAVIGNTARITVVVIVGEVVSHEAGAAIEQHLGLVTFAVALGLGLLFARGLEALRLRWRASS